MSVRKHTSLSLIAAGLALALSQPAVASDWSGNARLSLGAKQVDDKDWRDDRQDAMAIAVDFQRKDWPLAIAIDFVGAGSEQGSGASRVEEVSGGLHLGVRKYWQIEDCVLRPHLGGGLALLAAERRLGSGAGERKDDDKGTGAWIGGGVDIALAEHLTLGAELRYSQAEVSLFGADVEAGGLYSGLSLGTRW